MIFPPGSTIGIVGGGQLGRMLALAAAQLGYKLHIYAPDRTPPAAEVANRFTRGQFDNSDALARFASEIDVATFEFENVPAAALSTLGAKVPVYPRSRALEVAQDRLLEKNFIIGQGGRTAPFASVDCRDSLDAAIAEIGTPAILKTRRLGYDGKGQMRIEAASEAGLAWEAMHGAPSLLEALVGFDAEFSILLCRSTDGALVCWDAPHNVHVAGILDRSIVPAPAAIQDAIATAETLSRKAATALDYVGTMALEFFAVGQTAIFNEMAPRVHNSGHWTIEGSLTSQFENHVRAICGLPLGATDRTADRVEMRNLIGHDIESWPSLLADPRAQLHLYGKSQARPGRKMGHVTKLYERED